ncbi:FAD-binding oxidoreductase [Mesorhizobium sp. KR1-2]|uniref:FAD-binding oxidoreductase n=1 Tax=Mesorhizobium sp. KR1-2 TaxID=3156609 RepID=UPI0032B47371
MVDPHNLSRRSFLLGSSAAAGLLAVGPAKAEGAATLLGPSDSWERLRRLTQGRLVRPGETGYDKAALPNNLRYRSVRPAGVVHCNSAQMVAEVLGWCQDYDVPFAIRGGGHSYSGFSSSHDLVIDMREMHTVRYDEESGEVTVGAGALNGQVYDALRRAGRMITHGRCPTVGAAGFLLGGGIGFNMRRLGMGSDALAKAQIVTADGRVRDIGEKQDSDLFWAIRGGAGGNFGVSTEFTLRTVPCDERITVFRIVWRADTLAVAHALFAAADAAPTALGTRISLGGVTSELGRQGRQVPVTLLGQFAGSEQDLRAILAPVVAVAEPDFADVRELGYWEGQDFLAEPGAPALFRERSTFLPAAPDAAFLKKAFGHLQRWPGTGAHGDLFFFQTGGRINEVPSDATAFVHRSSRWLSVVGISWSEDDVARPEIARRAGAWQDEFYAGLGDLGGVGAFQNFPDIALVDWRQRYYGANLDRLMAVKAAVDPNNLFRYAQSI